MATKGFVAPLPRRGIQVNALTEKDIKDLYEVQITLETAIIRCALQKLTDEGFKRLQSIHNREREAIKSEDRLSYLRIDREFHFCPAKLTGNRYMIASVENIRDLIDWMGFKALTRQDRMEEVEQEHERIVEKLAIRDVKEAERLMEEHIRVTERNVLKYLKA